MIAVTNIYGNIVELATISKPVQNLKPPVILKNEYESYCPSDTDAEVELIMSSKVNNDWNQAYPPNKECSDAHEFNPIQRFLLDTPKSREVAITVEEEALENCDARALISGRHIIVRDPYTETAQENFENDEGFQDYNSRQGTIVEDEDVCCCWDCGFFCKMYFLLCHYCYYYCWPVWPRRRFVCSCNDPNCTADEIFD